jgi:acetyl esterase/lipase
MSAVKSAEADLDPDVRIALPRFFPEPDPGALDPVRAAREGLESVAHLGPSTSQPVAREDTAISGATGPIRARMYLPESSGNQAMVYFHGGGWISGSIHTHDKICAALAARLAVRVISVEYRRAPEHPYPAAVEDAWAAVLAVARERRWGGDPMRTVVAGDSAGGTLAAVIARRARDARIALGGQVLLYPVIDRSMNTESYQRFADGYGLTATAMQRAWRAYLAEPPSAISADAAPSRTADLRGLAPAVVITAGCDVLRDEGEAYAERLVHSGVSVARRRYPGLVHGFLRMAGEVRLARDAFEDLTAMIRAHLEIDREDRA